MRIYILLMLAGTLSTYLAVPLVKRLAVKVGAITAVRKRDIHTVPTPRMGGVSMFFGFLVTVLFAYSTPFLHTVFEYNLQIWAILLGSGLICLLGALDDIYDLDWMLKFAGQILIGAVVSLLGVQILSLPIFGLVVGSPLASVTATTFIIVLLMNAVNFIDGLDGLAAGIICIGSIAFFFYSYALSRTFLSYASLVTVLTVAIIGICIGFLGHNFAPASIFMGDAGSMQLGFLVSCASIMITGRIDPLSQPIPTLPAYMPIILPILIFMLPALDMFLAVVRRLKNKKSPFSPDRLHLHHRILNIIHSKPLAVVVLYLWAMLVAFSSLLTLFYPIQVVLIGFFGGVVVLGLFTFKIQSVINFAKLKIGRKAPTAPPRPPYNKAG